MPRLEVVGSYVGLETARRGMTTQGTDRGEVLFEHLLAASRAIEGPPINRRFFPVNAVNQYRWPPYHVAASWEVWTEDDLLSVNSLQVAATGQNAVPVTLTNYFLEPQQFGPPYNRIEVDLSSSDVFQAGPTPQRSVAITGQWGYCNTTVAAGTLAAAMADTTGTTLTCSNGTLIDRGDVLLIDSEALFVDYPRVPDTGPNLTVWRGVNGTTAATHSNAAPIRKYQAPWDVRRIVRADAISTFQADLASWLRTTGQGELEVEFTGKLVASYRQDVVNKYARKRTAAI